MIDSREASGSSAVTRYYEPAGRVGAGLLFWLPVLGGMGAILVGAVYALISSLFHAAELPAGSFFSMAAFAVVLTILGRGVCRLGSVRKRRMRLLITLLVGTIGLYASWHYYITFVSGPPFHLWPTAIMSPARMCRGMNMLAEDDYASIWLTIPLEGLLVIATVLFFTGEIDPGLPFCEKCGQWTAETVRRDFGDTGQSSIGGVPEFSIIDAFQRRQMETLAQLGERDGLILTHIRVRVFRCPCAASIYASLERVKTTRGNDWHLQEIKTSPRRSRYVVGLPSPNSEETTPLVENMAIDLTTELNIAAIQPKHLKAE